MNRATLFQAVKPFLPKLVRDRLRVSYQQASNWLRYGDRFFFLSVTMEISVFCNRTCTYCPNTDHATPREFMAPDVFELALKRLTELRWHGIVDFIFYNEPLLDPSLPEKVRRVKQAAPDCLPRITTNGDALTAALAEDLLEAGVVAFYVTRHVPVKPGWDERIEALRRRWPRHITVMDIMEVQRKVGLWNRAGLVKVEKEFKVKSCRAPEGAITIDRNGDVLLCCCDYFHANKFGNIRDKNLEEIWRGQRFRTVRENLRRGVALLDICKNCILRLK